MSGAYDDIIALPHHVSETHPPMSAIDRAAQFSPFAALTGFGAAIAETGRLTDQRIELDEHEKSALNEKLCLILRRLPERPVAALTYFLADSRKAGGAYVRIREAVKKIDEHERIVVMQSGTRVPMDDIAEIEIG